MKGDFTRSTFRPQKHYSSVRMQQGRLQVDADWNEQADITAYLREQQARNLLGQNVAAAARTAAANKDLFENFRVKPSADGTEFEIAAGQIYVNGVWCELQEPIQYTKQPDYPQAPKPQKEGAYLAYLDVWQRHITTVDDDFIRESALNSVPDTTTRLQTVCQVKLKPLAKENPSLEDVIATLKPPKPGKLAARLKPASGSANSGPSVDNTLYRVEIHKPGTVGTATFKWSKDNAIVVSRILSIKDNTLVVESPDGFSPGSWVEVTDTHHELRGEPGLLLQLTEKTTGTRLVFDPSKTSDGDKTLIDAMRFANRESDNILKVRRWDGNATQIKEGSSWIDLGNNGVQINFSQVNASSEQAGDEQARQYATGDYWLIPVRSISPQLDYWPKDEDNNPAAISSQGIQHNTAPLAFLRYTGTKFELAKTGRAESLPQGDFRRTFPTLTRALDSLGGVIEGSLNIQKNLSVQGKLTLSKGIAVSEFSNGNLSSSAESVPTEGAVKTYVDTEVQSVNGRVDQANQNIANNANAINGKADKNGSSEEDFSVNELLAKRARLSEGVSINKFSNDGLSDSAQSVPTEGAVKTYVDTEVQSIDGRVDQANQNIANNANAISGKADKNGSSEEDFSVDELLANSVRLLAGVSVNRFSNDELSDRTQSVPTEDAVKTYVDSKIRSVDKRVDQTAENNASANSGKADKNGSLEENFSVSELLAKRGSFSDRLNTRALDVENELSANQITAQSVAAQSISQESSQALKENISNLSSQEATILLSQLDPVKFSYRTDENQRIRTGFIAETVPDIVASANRQAVSPLDITAILTKMAKDHHLAIAQMNGAIAQMTSVIQQQQQEISALNATVQRLSGERPSNAI